MDDSCNLISPTDRRCASDTVIDAVAALRLANQAAASALGYRGCDGARDVAADALVLLLEKKKPFHRWSILATVKHLARRALRIAASTRPAPAPSLPEGEDDDLVEASWDAPEESGPPSEPALPFSRTFADGSTARLDGALCEADVADLTLEHPDGSVLRGGEALDAAHRLLLAERYDTAGAQHAGNARRAVAALPRDALLLSVAGLPWREALARLATHGIHVSRDGLRSGQRAARRRCAGRSAHDQAHVVALDPRARPAVRGALPRREEVREG
jgi:hypothetical protein